MEVETENQETMLIEADEKMNNELRAAMHEVRSETKLLRQEHMEMQVEKDRMMKEAVEMRSRGIELQDLIVKG